MQGIYILHIIYISLNLALLDKENVLFLGGAPTSLCHFFYPSARLSVMQHISGTVHHLIIIFGTHV